MERVTACFKKVLCILHGHDRRWGVFVTQRRSHAVIRSDDELSFHIRGDDPLVGRRARTRQHQMHCAGWEIWICRHE